ncbi:hypothetical protein INT43_007235 [Umbelopsis isabellina]|uniref:Uncharacterized protein n=1 Tax=Mortierella isabellina TaxID=91625 RepID=A0A8H7PYU6_MORIS|nr:hypothetical protein INT43_007235 [Umbelopsis isabellina]
MRLFKLSLVCATLILTTYIRATAIDRTDLRDSISSNVKRAEIDDPNSIFDNAERFRDAERELPKATSIEELDPNCAEVDDLRFHARLCRTVNCRQSLNNWDCENCTSILPDGEVLVYFNTAPHEIIGQIVRSKA